MLTRATYGVGGFGCHLACNLSSECKRRPLHTYHAHTHTQRRGRYSQTGRQSADTPADAAQSPVALLNMCKLCGINYYALYVISGYTNWLLHLPLCNPLPPLPVVSPSSLLLLPHSYFNNVACLPPGRACNNLSFEHDARTTHTHTYTNTHTVTHTRTLTEGE